jgi:hypothetical protein
MNKLQQFEMPLIAEAIARAMILCLCGAVIRSSVVHADDAATKAPIKHLVASFREYVSSIITSQPIRLHMAPATVNLH